MRTRFVSAGGTVRGVMSMRGQECTLPDTSVVSQILGRLYSSTGRA
jgi:hypothetical protein